MPQTTTAQNACNVRVFLDNASGALQDITGSSSSLDMGFTNEIGEFVTFDSCAKGRLECGKDWTFTLNAIYTTTTNEAFDILKNWAASTTCSGSARTLDIYIPDKNVGSDYWTMEVFLSTLSWTADRGDANAIMVSAEFLPNGTVTHTVAST
jgi:hypothetical protein